MYGKFQVVSEVRAGFYLVLCAGLFLELTGCGAHSTTPVALTGAVIQVSPGSISFGQVTVGQTAATSITVANTGDEALTITQLQTSGQNLWTSTANPLPVQIEAGQSHPFTLNFKPTSAAPFNGQLSIQSSAANSPALSIPVSGSGSAVSPAPSPQLTLSATNVDFGTQSPGASSTKALTLSSSGTAPVTVKSLAVTGGEFSVGGATLPLILNPGQLATVQVKFTPVSNGTATGQVTIESDSATSPKDIVTLTGSGGAPIPLTPELKLSASSLSFGNVTLGQEASQFITLQSTGTAAVTVSSIVVNSTAYLLSGAGLPLSIDPGKSATLHVAFKPSVEGPSTAQLTLKSNASNAATTVIPLSGAGENIPTTPKLSVSATALSFGNVNVGGSAKQSVTLASTGTAAVTVNSLTLSGGSYSLSGAAFPVTIAPGLQVSFAVVFKPGAAGAATGQLTIKSNSAAGAVTSIALTGAGIALTPQIRFSTNSLSYGNVTVGYSAVQTLTLTSSGNTAVTVSSVVLAGKGYSATGATFPVSLASGQTITLQLAFKPMSTGAAAGAITLKSTAANNAALSVALSGNGVPPTPPNPNTPPSGTALRACADLTSSGIYYLAQDVSSAGTCFFIDANNITLNLNGHTITYGTGGGTAGTPGILLADDWYNGANTYSLAKSGSTRSHGGFEVYNGTIQSSPSAAPQSRGIWVGQSSDISPAPKVHDLTINTTAVDANPIFGDSSLSGWQIYNNKLSYGATGPAAITNRYLLYGYAIWMADTLNAAGVISDEIYSNQIVAAPQGGIYDTNQNAHIHNNTITFNSYFTNDYCVAAISGNGAVITYNSCAPTSGRGYDIEASNVTLSNNTATVKELVQNAEYGGCELGGADGIRIKDNFHTAGGGAPAPPVGAIVTGNVITAEATVCQANALRLSFLYPGDTATISGNSFTSVGNGAKDFAISFDQVDASPLTFSGNTFSAHLAHIQIDYDGVIAGYIQAGQTWAGTPQYSIYDIDGGADTTNPAHPGVSSLIVDDNMPTRKFCGGVSSSTLLVGGTSLNCP